MLEHLKVLCLAAMQEPTRGAEALLGMLQGLDCRVHRETRLAAGLEALSAESFDLVLLDLELPDGDGAQGLEAIRQADSRLPVVVLADERTCDLTALATSRGAHGVVFKGGLSSTRLAHVLRLAIEHRRAERDLAYRGGKYQDIVENMQDSYYETGLDEKLIYVNKTCCRHLGRTREQCLGMRSKAFVAPEVYQRNMDLHIEIYKTGIGGKVVNIPIVRPDGSRRTVEVRVTLMRDEQGKPVAFGGISRDVTEYLEVQQQLKASKEKHQEMLENLEDTYFETDLKGRMLFWNHASGKTYGYTIEELKDLDYRAFIAPEDTAMVHAAYEQAFQTGKPCKGLQYGVIRKDGTKAFLECTISLLRDGAGHPTGFRGVGRDITARKAAELELVQAKSRAEAATRAKSEFLANMSHEIRTPMNGILGMYTLLENTPLSPEQTEYVQTGKHSANNLLMVLNDILDYSKIEAGRLEVECIDFDLRKTIDELITGPARQAHEKGLELIYKMDCEVPSRLRGDPDRLRQVVMNLVTNAVKFTEKGEVALYVQLEQEIENQVTLRFVIRDTGIGISKIDQRRLFKSFEQVDSSFTRRYGGTGLGLAIARRLVELMGGTRGLESKQGAGSTFWFTVTFEKGCAAPHPAMRVPDRIKEKHILIVDDNKTNLEILDGYLKQWGCTCDRATGAALALEMMKAVAKAGAPYDLVISDMLMPEMDGAELGRCIKSDEALKETVLIMLTSQGMRGDAAEMRSIGYAAYLTKPVRPETLFECLVTIYSHGETPDAEKKAAPIISSCTLSAAKRQKVRILVAEDNAVNRKLALHLLSRFGFTADAVENGKKAVEALAQKDYDLVLMDVNMPEMDGLTASRIIRDPQSAVLRHDIPIIAMTAHAAPGDRHHYLNAKMNDYIAKPIDPDLLLKLIEKMVEEARAA